MLLQLFCIIILFLLSVVCLYYWFLLFASFSRAKDETIKGNKKITFAIVIPAHNEEDVIAATLSSCKGLEYPADKYQIFVVADNCTDKTADMARKHDVAVFERFDDSNKGKGFALAWAFDRILQEDFDVILVVDADCLLDAGTLAELTVVLAQGDEVIQINYCVGNPDESPMSYALAVGNFIENELFYAPKSQLGMAVILRGTGMAIKADVLRKYPWDAHSIVEDIEYSLSLIKANYAIKFLKKVRVISPFPVTHEQLKVQRTRWASGNLSFGKKEAFNLILEGVKNRNMAVADAGWSFLVLSKPLLLLGLCAAVLVSIACVFFAPGDFSTFLLIFALVVTFLYIAYFVVGIYRFGLSWRRFFYLMQVPVTVINLMFVSMLGLIGFKKDDWARTPRS
ncbi:MAG: hypothetical protein BM485_07895 [Desulfobulbaceae bacterium DB1]|nr:MAG: hypothetical protein BM485_07895 [Desulfobulbaceae bacterium DB1]